MAAILLQIADHGHQDGQKLLKLLSLQKVITDVIDVQDECAIVDAVCNAASNASNETREAALQWLLTQHHNEVSMLACGLRVERMCFLVDCFLAFSFVWLVWFEM